LITFGGNVATKVSSQMVLYLLTSPNYSASALPGKNCVFSLKRTDTQNTLLLGHSLTTH